MSADGRAQDALLTLIDGYGLEDKDRYEIAEDVIKVIGPLYMELGERTAKARLLAEMSEHGIKFGDKTMTDEISLEAQLAALRGSMAIMAQQHADQLLREKQNTQWWKERADSFGLSADRWRERAEELEAHSDVSYLVILELGEEDFSPFVSDVRDGCKITVNGEDYKAKGISVLRQVSWREYDAE